MQGQDIQQQQQAQRDIAINQHNNQRKMRRSPGLAARAYDCLQLGVEKTAGLAAWVMCDFFFHIPREHIIAPSIAWICNLKKISDRFGLVSPTIKRAFIINVTDIIAQKARHPLSFALGFLIIGPAFRYTLFGSIHMAVRGIKYGAKSAYAKIRSSNSVSDDAPAAIEQQVRQ